MILWELNGGTKRFSALQAALPEIAAQVLTVQLRQLEAWGTRYLNWRTQREASERKRVA